MREIKFRAWDIDRERFIYLDLNDPDPLLFGRHGTLENTVTEDWQQYTGLKDKIGQEVYEGDILLFKIYTNKHRVNLEVVYTAPRFHTRVIGDVPDWMMDYGSQNILVRKALKRGVIDFATVLGNIHQNPELLNTKE